MIAGAWGVISASANLVIGTKKMTEKAHQLLQTELHGVKNMTLKDRNKLLGELFTFNFCVD